jgi:hypothetical protein
MNLRCLLGVLVSISALTTPILAQPALTDYPLLTSALEEAALAGSTEAYLSLISPDADREAAALFAGSNLAAVDRVRVVPRFEVPIDDLPAGDGYDLTVEIFSESENQGHLETWRLEIVRVGEGDEAAWRIRHQTSLDSIDGLRHLRLTPTKQYAANNMVVLGEDLSLTLVKGSVFVAETESGVTGLVLLGEGIMHFAPQPEAEQGQLRIFDGNETLEAKFETAFIRLHPEAYNSRVSTSGLVEEAVDRDVFEKATEVFDAFIGLTFTIDLSDVSDKLWSINPGVGDFLAEVSTKQHGVLSYTQSGQQPEDISLYDRASNRIISLYPSARRRATQGRYFGDDEIVPLDVLDYDITASFEPLGVTQQSARSLPKLIGCRIVGTTRLAVRVNERPVTTFSLLLADELRVTSVSSREYGPLLFFRLNGQNNLLVNLPDEVPSGTEFTVTISYVGNLPGQELEENSIASESQLFEAQPLFGVGSPRYIYSSRSYWYPQALFSDYATATATLSAPPGWGIVASGYPLATNPPVAQNLEGHSRPFSFATLQPARYLAALISRFEPHEIPTRQVRLPEAAARPSSPRGEGAVYYDTVAINAHTSRLGMEDVGAITDQVANVTEFFASLLGDIPYPSMAVAVTDSRLPGGHSPAYFAVLNHELPRQAGIMVSWKTDPVSFNSYPPFFLAHEVAHQWWGQAVGGKNYHEQWLSEGLAQYFAALYAEHDADPEVFNDILQQMRRWAKRHTDKGPIYLGYRLGHLKHEPRVFRALVYNKGAMVLHMLRGLIGDDAFFAGLRRFYHEWRFKKAGTDALQLAFEIESGQSLTRFFERWIHEATLPELRFSSHTETTPTGEEVVLQFDQQTERLFDIPVTVDLTYQSGEVETVVVPVTERVTVVRVPARGRLRRVRPDPDGISLAEIDR